MFIAVDAFLISFPQSRRNNPIQQVQARRLVVAQFPHFAIGVPAPACGFGLLPQFVA